MVEALVRESAPSPEGYAPCGIGVPVDRLRHPQRPITLSYDNSGGGHRRDRPLTMIGPRGIKPATTNCGRESPLRICSPWQPPSERNATSRRTRSGSSFLSNTSGSDPSQRPTRCSFHSSKTCATLAFSPRRRPRGRCLCASQSRPYATGDHSTAPPPLQGKRPEARGALQHRAHSTARHHNVEHLGAEHGGA